MILNTAKRDIRPRLWPFILSAGIILADQAAKIAVLKLIPGMRAVPVIGDFLRFINVQNPAIAWSIGASLARDIQRGLFLLLPLAVVVVLTLYYLLTRDPLTRLQRWTFGALIGGGLGNYVDRIFRPAGVVDFIDFKFYGLFGLPRFPTFNLADTSVVVAGILLFITFLLPQKKTGAAA
jgi:signal peptidase II